MKTTKKGATRDGSRRLIIISTYSNNIVSDICPSDTQIPFHIQGGGGSSWAWQSSS